MLYTLTLSHEFLDGAYIGAAIGAIYELTLPLPLKGERKFFNVAAGAAIGGTINLIFSFADRLNDTNRRQDRHIQELFSRLEACEEKK